MEHLYENIIADKHQTLIQSGLGILDIIYIGKKSFLTSKIQTWGKEGEIVDLYFIFNLCLKK